MLTSIDQVRDWITDNGFKRWVLYTNKSKTEMIIDSNAFPLSDITDKIAMTEKYLRLAGGYAYAVGGAREKLDEMRVCAEIRLNDAQPQYPQIQVPAGVGAFSDQTIGELRKSIEESIDAKWEKRLYEKERKEFEEEKKQFEADRNGVLGAIVGYLAPYIPVLNSVKGQQGRLVAGTPADAEAPVHVQPIVPDEQQEQQPASPWDDFTEDEADELIALMARFKKVEPDYLKLIAGVVKMKESGNPLYDTAKGMLLNMA